MNSSSRAIHVSDLAVQTERNHGQKVLLSDISFTVAQGSFVGIIGASGCGKTTLLRALAGVLPASWERKKGDIHNFRCCARTSRTPQPRVDCGGESVSASAKIMDVPFFPSEGVWLDVDLKRKAKPYEIAHYPSLTGWLPDIRLLDHWKGVHEP